MNLTRLTLRARALFGRRGAERDLEDELSFHIERETQKHIANGLSPAEARIRARATFGSVTVAADQCRDERGTAIVDNLVRDVLYAFRTFRRAPMAALTIVTTVALGLGLVTVVFTLLNALIFRLDDVRNPRELFSVERPQSAHGERGIFTLPQYEALVRETSVFSGSFAMLTDIDSRVEGRTMTAALVTTNFFDVLGVEASLGRRLTSSDDEHAGGQPVVVLSHSGWVRHFRRDPGVLNRTVVLNRVSFQIVGVMPDGFRGLMVSPPDYWTPLSFLELVRGSHGEREDSVGVGIVGRLKPGLSREQALAQLVVWDLAQAGPSERRSANLALVPKLGTAPTSEAMLLLAPLFFAFGLILMIGCANVANLLLARAIARQREIGIRLATGASRGRIVCQLLTESLLLALVAAVLAFAISRGVLEATLYLVLSTMPPDIGDIRLAIPPWDWRVALFLLGGALVSTMAFALIPAFQATRLELVRAIRGEVVRDARPGHTRHALIALQVTASALLLICSAVFLRSAMVAATVDPGIRTTDTVVVGVANENTRTALLEAIRREPYVASFAASWPEPIGPAPTAVADGIGGKSTVAYKFVSPEFFGVLGIDVIRGRNFTSSERSASSAVVVVSESVAHTLWPGRDAVGQTIQLGHDSTGAAQPANEPPPVSGSFSVVGVARNVPGFRFFKFNEMMVYLPTSAETAQTALTLRVHGDPELARRALLDRLTIIDVNLSQVVTLRTFAGMETYFLRLGFWLTLALGGLALVLTLSGLFSVLSYLVEQRIREIGVRIALGATHRNICVLVLSQLTRPVGFGLLAGGCLAAALGTVLLSTSSEIATIVRLFDPVAYGMSTLCIVLACACAALVPALRAGRTDPLTTLRQE
jgi:predicted permease